MSKEIKKQIEELYTRLNKGDITDTKIISALESLQKEMSELKETFAIHDKQEMLKYDTYDTHLSAFNNTMLNVGNKLEAISIQIDSNENKYKASEKNKNTEIKKLNKEIKKIKKEGKATYSRQQNMIWVGTGAISIILIVAYTISWFTQNKETLETRLAKQEHYNELDYKRWQESQKP